MAQKRLIPVVIIKEGLLVRSQLFKYHQAIGDPIPTIKRLSDWNADEIVLLNIGNSKVLDSRREDKYHNLGQNKFKDLVQQTTKFCQCPITIGGGLRNEDEICELFEAGADKIILNSICYDTPEIVRNAVNLYGSQAITASIDIKTIKGKTTVWTDNGAKDTGLTIKEAMIHVRELGAGELLLSSIDHDGSGKGFDRNIFKDLDDAVDYPIIVNSGATLTEHFLEGLQNKHISAVAASNVFYFTEMSYPNIKKEIIENGFTNIRDYELNDKFSRREPELNQKKREIMLEKAKSNFFVDHSKYDGSNQVDSIYCKRCLYSSASATPMQFDSHGICMGCRIYEEKQKITPKKYENLKSDLTVLVRNSLTQNSLKRKYDCIVSVSGGKDSYYQVHYVKEKLGLNPLLVTYNGNNYTNIGWENLWNMREAFDCDHIVVSPSVTTIKKLNRLAFIVMGDMNWHAHVGIFTTAPRIAIDQNIPLIFWGEHGYADLCGQFSMSDFPEMNYRERTEHAGRGFDWPFFVGVEGITEQDMETWKYPTDEEIMRCGLRQIYLGHYIPWESNEHLKLVRDRYGFKVSNEPFERTYRVGSNLDDIHENGVHDYLKYIKFGYGRCTDHASKDIRSGDLTRAEGIKRATVMDKIKPKDLRRWLEYVEMTEAEFDRIADHFRDPRVWKWDDEAGWSKKDIIS